MTGYEVGIIMTGNTYMKLINFYERRNVPNRLRLINLTDEKYLLTSGNLYFYFPYIKWYSGYEEVNLFEEFIESIDEEDYRIIVLPFYVGEYYGKLSDEEIFVGSSLKIDEESIVEILVDSKYYIFIDL